MSDGYQFYYGPFTHPTAEVRVAGINVVNSMSPTHRVFTRQETWNLEGKIIEQGPTAQTQLMADLAARYETYGVTNFDTNGYSAGFLLNGNPTPWSLDSSGAIGGVAITQPISFKTLAGADGITYVHYNFALMRESFLANASDYLEYQETTEFSDNGGGPLLVWRQPVSGFAIAQARTTNSVYNCIQQGHAKMRGGFPHPEAMLFPGLTSGEEGCSQVSYGPVDMYRGTAIGYTTKWRYSYRSTSSFFWAPYPHVRG